LQTAPFLPTGTLALLQEKLYIPVEAQKNCCPTSCRDFEKESEREDWDRLEAERTRGWDRKAGNKAKTPV